MKTARERFQEGPHRAEWEKIVASGALEEAVAAASLEFMALPSEPQSAHWRTCGVQDFINILCSLHAVKQPEPPEPMPPQLDYSVGKPKR